MIPLGIVALLLAQPERITQPVAGNLLVTARGCAWKPNEALPDWCGPLMWEQGSGELRNYREHVKREIRRKR